MKIIKLILSLLLCATMLFLQVQQGFAQSTESQKIAAIIDSTLSVMKDNALNAKNVNWNEIKENALRSAKDLHSPYELGPTMRTIYKSLNDFHGAFFYRDSTFQWHRNSLIISDSIMNEWKKGVTVKTELLANHIGYLRIPSMPIVNNDDFNTKAQNLNDSLCTLLSKNVKGIILDLRLNGGGAMHPMILGVENLLGSGKVGTFITKTKEDWIIKDHKFLVGGKVISSLVPKCNINAQNIPVVILVSPVTGSSAEFLIMTFKGRNNTVLLGSSTAGVLTINSGFPINEETFINLSVGYGADRQGNVYRQAIPADIPFTSVDQFNNIQNDGKVKAAIEWLKTH
ncbi:MAG: Peptidase family [Daejeonella sp.]|nr:Peptidase family [Daejeonella sp.]